MFGPDPSGSSARSFNTTPEVRVDGEEVKDVRWAAVDLDLTQPGMCQVHIVGASGDTLTESGSQLGREITVSASPIADTDPVELFAGVVHEEHLHYDESDGTRIELVAYDETYRLNQASISRSFQDGTVEDAIRDLCREVGLEIGTVALDATTRPYLAIVAETPREFCQRHAAEGGAVLVCRDGKLDVVVPAEAADGPEPGDPESVDPLQLVLGHNVTSLDIRVASAGQAGSVVVRGWDPTRKEAPTGDAEVEARTADSRYTASETATDLGTPVLEIPRPARTLEADLTAAAGAIATQLASEHMVVNGTAHGDPRITAGEVVSFGAADRLDGRFLVTRSRHVFDGSYRTEFDCTGLNDHTLLSLLDPVPPRRFYGLYPAVVESVNDEESTFRVRLTLPWLGDDFVTSWARVCQLGAGPSTGIQWYPDHEDEVMVAFVDGDPEAPVVVGGVFGEMAALPFDSHVDAEAGRVTVRGLRTTAGHVIELNDTDGEQLVRLRTADEKLRVELNQADQTLTVHAEGELVLSSGGDLTISAGGKAVVSGAGVDIDAGGSAASVKGSSINLG